MTKEMSSFDQAEKIKGRVTEKIARVAIAAGVGLAGCTPTLLRPNEPIETPSQGQALAIGLLNEQSINNLPDGEVKTSFVNELNDIKKDCAEIPGCLTDTIQIYRVNVNDPEEGTNVFSYHFANIDDSEGLRTQILSVTDGKTQEKTEINEDLVTKDTVIEGIPTRVFGYVDDNGNSHYLLVDREVSGQNQFQIYDAEGTSYDVITQNEKEVQAYSSFWSAPGIVEAASLPTNTPTAEATPTPEVLSVDDFKVVDGKIQEEMNGNWQEVSVPTEMGEIAYVEEHEGKMYGIDTADRAIVVRNEAGEWVKFERPIFGADFNKIVEKTKVDRIEFFGFSYNEETLSDIYASRIYRMLDAKGNPLQWGYQKDSYNWKDEGIPETDALPDLEYELSAEFSGYFLGIINGNVKVTAVKDGVDGRSLTAPKEFLIFEIPYKYERQLVAVYAPKNDFMYYINYCQEFDNTTNKKFLTGKELNNYFYENMNKLIGKQVVITLTMRPNIEGAGPSDFWSHAVRSEAYDSLLSFPITDQVWISNDFMK